ncbi:hypothetical protein ACTWQL_09005 [Pseudalkalibacillus sp. R45]|uniref:hypothetical protein n=1 Tax=Pseudalkalibacillus sp. R45 TaxID=3457433 RepID=UPI003FCDB19D
MNNTLLEAVKTLLTETFDGPKKNESWYTEAKPGSGIFGTLDRLSAEEASIPIQGTTIAAQTDHTRYYLWVANTYMKGEKPNANWEESWKITSVDQMTWQRFKNQLDMEYKALLEKIERLDTIDEETANGLCGTLAHSAYHLGSIRQMVKVIKVPSETTK